MAPRQTTGSRSRSRLRRIRPRWSAWRRFTWPPASWTTQYFTLDKAINTPNVPPQVKSIAETMKNRDREAQASGCRRRARQPPRPLLPRCRPVPSSLSRGSEALNAGEAVELGSQKHWKRHSVIISQAGSYLLALSRIARVFTRKLPARAGRPTMSDWSFWATRSSGSW